MESNFDIQSVEEFIYGKDQPLTKFFKPKSVAVIGASEKKGSVGQTLISNLIKSPCNAIIYPINVNRSSVMGIKAYPNVKSIGEKIDLAVICIPAKLVCGVVLECAKIGITSIIIISAGFSEAGEQGKKWADEILEISKEYKMKIIGPNCLGVMCPISGLNATFANEICQKGKVGIISQSGALETAMLDYAFNNNLGFSAAVSVGSMIDVGLGDLIEYFGNDPETESIAMYVESIGDARKFINAARSVSLTKPIFLIKVGKTNAGTKAAASHTGTLTGDSEIINSAFSRCGICQVDSIEELFTVAEFLGKQPRPKGKRLAIITNAGGPGALSVDALASKGGQLANISEKCIKELNKFLPEHWSHSNPVDILGDATPEMYAKTLQIVADDAECDAILIILTPQAMTDPTSTAKVIKKYYLENFLKSGNKKPIFVSWMGGKIVIKGKNILSKCGIPCFDYPDVAVGVFNKLWKYNENILELHNYPDKEDLVKDNIKFEYNHDLKLKAIKFLEEIIKKNEKRQEKVLTEFESKNLLKMYQIPVTETFICENEENAVKAAQNIGFPVVLKIHSETITHKTDVGGVKLNLKNEEEVKKAFLEIKNSLEKLNKLSEFNGVTVQSMIKLSDSYEVIIGSKVDPQIGPIILFGQGGSLVELYKDTAIEIPPLTRLLARKLINSTKISTALKGYRNKGSINMEELENIIFRFSQMIVDLRRYIKEVDINPLLCSTTDKSLIALDARIVYYDSKFEKSKIQIPAIRPYPRRYAQEIVKFPNDIELSFRPAHIEDHPFIKKFFKKISEIVNKNQKEINNFQYAEAFFKLMRQQERQFYKEVAFKSSEESNFIDVDSQRANDLFIRMCMGNTDKEIVFIVLPKGLREIVGIGIVTRFKNDDEVGEFLITVSNNYQNLGIGRKLFDHIKICVKQEGIKKLICKIPNNNENFKIFVEKNDFKIKEIKEGGWIAELNLEIK